MPKRTKQKGPERLGKGASRKLEIINATLECLSGEGLFHTTFESIGKRIGIGKSHVLYHFPNLDDLIATALGYAYSSGQDIVTEFLSSTNDQPLLDRYIEGAFYWIRQHPSHAVAAVLLLYQSTISPKYRKIQTEVRLIGLERIATILGAEKPRWDKKKLRETAEVVQALVLGGLAYATLNASPSEYDRFAKLVKSACRDLIS